MATAKVSAPNNLEWTVKRLVLPDWMRPIRMESVARQYAHGPADGLMGGSPKLGLPAMLFGVVWMLATLPFLPLVLLLRRAGLVPWTLQAVTRPWGRRGPATVLRYHIRGSREVELALADLVAKLERGDGAPDVVGAERI
jgi:hypothetical protein